MEIVHLSYIQIPDNGMVRVDLKHPSAPHEFQAGCITHTLCLHQPAASLVTCCTLLLKRSKYTINLRKADNLSMFADQPNFPDTRTQGEELSRFEICTLATFSPSRFLIQSHVWPNSCFISFSFSSFLSPKETTNGNQN